ncbi:hypothetical protein Dsin_004715 [Dipteronia sinensis]|uniref:DUF4283 domain-containing protein n=1 Tax=Dipteronia sinensis TaxID=43782 RepID=A0AAE0AVX4_9ROSI|nr:hypothetical protein Dsin_004715 [Dipteronia sinensis]
MTTNGMQVYGWPIYTKLAAYGWKTRSYKPTKQRFRNREEGRQHGQNLVRKEKTRHRSYAEIVRGHREEGHNNKEKEKGATVVDGLDFRKNDQVWLSCSAVGILKDFKEVSRVKTRLQNGGIEFTSTYLGDKCILWCFDCELIKDRFIKDRGLWDDCFSIMVGWSEVLSTHAKLAWINCKDIPIACWPQAFFMKLGWQIDEPLLVDDNIVNRVHLDKGRVLVLIPHQQPVSAKVKIIGGTKTYVVKVEEDVNTVDIGWIENLLALKKNRVPKDRNRTPVKENFQIYWSTEVGVAVSKFSTLVGKGVIQLRGDMSPTNMVEEVSTNGGTISKEEWVKATIAAEERLRGIEGGELERNGDTEVFSSDNSVSKEEKVRATIEVEKKMATSRTEISNEEELVRTTMAAEEMMGIRQGIRQSSRSKTKVSSLHGMRTRNSINRGSDDGQSKRTGLLGMKAGYVEEEVAKTVETGIALGFEFAEVEDEMLEEMSRREMEDTARFEAMDGYFGENVSLPWCIGGDFNSMLDPMERKGRWCDSGSIRKFNSFVLRVKVLCKGVGLTDGGIAIHLVKLQREGLVDKARSIHVISRDPLMVS